MYHRETLHWQGTSKWPLRLAELGHRDGCSGENSVTDCDVVRGLQIVSFFTFVFVSHLLQGSPRLFRLLVLSMAIGCGSFNGV